MVNFTIIVLLFLIITSDAKIFKRCELAQELALQHKIDKEEASIWTCIADKLNTDLNTNSSSNEEYVGIFAIHKKFWCAETSEEESRCGITCDKLLDDDITDDLCCVRDVINSGKNYKREYEAWPVYEEYCQLAWKDYFKECFGKREIEKSRQDRTLFENYLEEDPIRSNRLQLGVKWDSFGPEPDYLLNEMFSDQPKRLKRIN